ncbi:hypothetical protein EJ06DRAFT_531444 [Trichodelitschia bisporula]|uniref:Voltage-gated hydrogen channel 1 n=1 Tax=Trichodelitschia bisporula TaxID=703511 RepID=A0A6G1HSZ4_9PEZI|nr:hypothetical protein EJ06DRAFT_531444 [Trichodelitschia bisporula]
MPFLSHPIANFKQWIQPGAHAICIPNPRERIQNVLTSKTGHYAVIMLVVLDVTCVIAEFLVQLFRCESGGKGRGWQVALDTLAATGLTISCLFVAELLVSVWAFGLSYFRSPFRCFDALVILAGLVADTTLRGLAEEVASLVIVLRLWRIIKIVEELSLGAKEQNETMQEKIEALETENARLKRELCVSRPHAESGQLHSSGQETLLTPD